MIVTDGAAIYEKPDFDSKVLDFVPFETKVVISRKAYAGKEGLGLFHKVKARGKIGYIPDTDVRVSDKAASTTPEPPKVKVAGEQKSKSMAWDKEEEGGGRAPVYLTRYLGGAISRVKFTETFEGRRLSDQVLMYGLRMTGPGTLFDGPPLDMNLWFSLDKPGYYNNFSSGINGFMMFGDIMAMMPLVNLDNWVVSYGLGVMWSFTRYRVVIRGENADTSDLRLGVDAGIGVGARIAKYNLLRFDAKYYYERNQYVGYVMSFQTEY